MSNEVIFESERLRCRRWIPEDLQPLFAVYCDVEGARWVGNGEPITFAACEEWLRVTEANYLRRGYGMFALEQRSSRQVIGFCGLIHPGDQPEVEIKYALLRSYWGRGLASEAVPALLAYGAERHGLTHIVATVAEGNIASQRVLSKAGMTLSHVATHEDGSRTQVHEWHPSDSQ